MIRASLLVPALTPALVLPLAAQDFEFTIDGAASASVLDASTSVDLPGTLIGDFDATANPRGTQTIPGLFGGSGNSAIDVDLGLGIELDFDGSANGTFRMAIDADAGTVVVEDLDLDLLGGSSASATLVLSLLYNTFQTANPTSLFIGGFPVDLPLGSQDLSDVQLVQGDLPGVGVLTPTRTEGTYTFVAGVPAEIAFTVDGALTGKTPIGPVPVVVPLAGTVVLAGGSATVTVDLDVDTVQSLPDPAPGFELTDVPLPLPTILPPGGTANLLFTSSIGSIDVDLLLDASLVATGTVSCGFVDYCPANPNTSGWPGLLAAVGSTSLAAPALTLEATQLPIDQFGYVIASTEQDLVPFFLGGDGNLCLADPLAHFRSTIQFSGRTSTMSFPLDFDDLPEGVVFEPGTTWNFQVWFRDVGEAPAHNTTNGIAVTWCP